MNSVHRYFPTQYRFCCFFQQTLSLYTFPELMDPVVLSERPQSQLERQPVPHHHIQHSGGLLGLVQPHRTSFKTQRGLRLQSFQSKEQQLVQLERQSLILLCLLQEGIKPMWEDEKNRHGGRWLINLDKKQRMSSLDNFWLEVMLCLIGESFEDHSQYVSNKYTMN